jgi:hypothetical protein
MRISVDPPPPQTVPNCEPSSNSTASSLISVGFSFRRHLVSCQVGTDFDHVKILTIKDASITHSLAFSVNRAQMPRFQRMNTAIIKNSHLLLPGKNI